MTDLTIDGEEDAEALERIGMLVDRANDDADPLLADQALALADVLEARGLAELRNHLEHKYVKVHEMGPPKGRVGDPLFDTLAHAISRTDLERRTLKLMQLVRAALIYLFLGMHRQERRREPSEYTLPMPLDPWQESWKQ